MRQGVFPLFLVSRYYYERSRNNFTGLNYREKCCFKNRENVTNDGLQWNFRVAKEIDFEFVTGRLVKV